MNYFIHVDHEDDGKNIDVLSIAIISDNGSKFYGINNQEKTKDMYDKKLQTVNTDWGVIQRYIVKLKMKDNILEFLNRNSSSNIEFWMNLQNRNDNILNSFLRYILDLPKGYPLYANNIKHFKLNQERLTKKVFILPEFEGGGALSKAKYVKQCYEYLTNNNIK